MGEPFDPNEAGYYHTGCCDSHVTRAALYVAVTSVVSVILRTAIVVHFNGKDWNLYASIFTCADIVCILLLLGGVYWEIRHLLLPYMVLQIFGTMKIIYHTSLQLSGEREISSADGQQPTKGIRMFIFIMRILWIVLIVYFLKIIFNFYLFLNRREAAEKKYGPAGIPPILPYQPQYEDEYQPRPAPYQAQPNSQYQEYPPQDHLARYQEYPPQDHLARYQDYPPQDLLPTRQYQEYPPQDHIVRYKEYPPQDHLVKNEPPPPYPKPRQHSYVSIEGDQTMMHPSQHQDPGRYQGETGCPQHPHQSQKQRYQPSGCGMIVAAMGNSSFGGFAG